MTKEKAISIVKNAFSWYEDNARESEEEDWSGQHEALRMAIQALEAQPCEEDFVKHKKEVLERIAKREREIDKYIKELETLKQQPSEDCISREVVIDGLDRYIKKAQSTGTKDDFISFQELVVKQLPSVTPKARWIPIKTRPMTEEEKEEIGHEYAYMYDCPLPDDGQDVVITDCFGNVEVDTFCRDCEGVYFETNCDDGEVMAWMPLPQPYNAESEDAEC